jgi:GntR family transcriptional regulator
MIIDLDHHSGVPIYRQVIDQVRRLIGTGQLAPGDALESVKSLSTRLKVNPMTISKAYGFLVQEGLVARRRGIGLFVAERADGEARRMKQDLLAAALENAAALAVQMDVSDEEAGGLFARSLARYRARKEGGKS